MKPSSPISFDPRINLSETFSGSNLGEEEESDTSDGCDEDQKEDLTLNLFEDALSSRARFGRFLD